MTVIQGKRAAEIDVQRKKVIQDPQQAVCCPPLPHAFDEKDALMAIEFAKTLSQPLSNGQKENWEASSWTRHVLCLCLPGVRMGVALRAAHPKARGDFPGSDWEEEIAASNMD